VRIRSDETVRIRSEDDVTTRLPADPLPDELLPDDPPDFEEPGS
jgi:hypothetical protein